jgi:thiol:disulfide interchange protein DsbD
MPHNLVTYLQLFGIGFGFGLSGPCLLVCAPVILTYVSGRQEAIGQNLADIMTFLTGRLLAYLVLGYLAGLSALILKDFSGSRPVLWLRPLGGVIIILLGLYVFSGKQSFSWLCGCRPSRLFGLSSLFALGFIMGIFPCAPLIALLLEITLVAKSAVQGMLAAAFFGLGTFVSGLIVIGTLSGLISWLPQKFLKSASSNFVFRLICAALLIVLGLDLILRTRIVS